MVFNNCKMCAVLVTTFVYTLICLNNCKIYWQHTTKATSGWVFKFDSIVKKVILFVYNSEKKCSKYISKGCLCLYLRLCAVSLSPKHNQNTNHEVTFHFSIYDLDSQGKLLQVPPFTVWVVVNGVAIGGVC